MPNLLEYVDFLHDFLLRVSVLHVALVDGLDGDLPTSELVYAKSHLTEGTLSDKLNELVELK